jgi:hypothetical protein
MSETATGLMGEYIAAATVLQFGFKVSLAQQDKVDAVFWDDANDFYRVQVKTASLSAERGNRAPVYHFQLGHGCKTKHLPTEEDYDLLCLVGAEHRRTLWMPIWSVRQYTKRVQAKLLDEAEAERASFFKAIETVRQVRDGRREAQRRTNLR